MEFEFKKNKTGITITKYRGNDLELYIPEKIDGLLVTAIGDYVFENCENLKSITLPETVKTIGMWAFAWCSNLKSISISSGLRSIGDYAFAGCSKLKSIRLPGGLTSIGYGAFADCVVEIIGYK